VVTLLLEVELMSGLGLVSPPPGLYTELQAWVIQLAEHAPGPCLLHKDTALDTFGVTQH
jgi:hypothetical protein